MGGVGSGRKPHQGAGVVAIPDAPAAVVTIPRRPAGLGSRGAREWPLIWTSGGRWLRADQDYPWVEQICRAWDDIARYRTRVRKDGDVQHGSQGQPVAHPLIAEIKHCEDTIRKALTEIGFSPAARHRLALAQARTAGKLDELGAKREERARAAMGSAAPVIEAVVISDSADDDAW